MSSVKSQQCSPVEMVLTVRSAGGRIPSVKCYIICITRRQTKNYKVHDNNPSWPNTFLIAIHVQRVYRLQRGNTLPDYTAFQLIPTLLEAYTPHASYPVPSNVNSQVMFYEIFKLKARSESPTAVAGADWLYEPALATSRTHQASSPPALRPKIYAMTYSAATLPLSL